MHETKCHNFNFYNDNKKIGIILSKFIIKSVQDNKFQIINIYHNNKEKS